MRVQFSTRNCVAFLSSRKDADVEDVMTRCRENADLLRAHPLYFLSFIYEHRYERWTDWFSELWGNIALVETATRMTHPSWELKEAGPERLQPLSSASTLLKQLHATNTEFCHTHTVMSSARKFGVFSLAAVDELERRRVGLGFPALRMRERTNLEESIKSISMQFETFADRLAELQARLAGQINVVGAQPLNTPRVLRSKVPCLPARQSYNLIAQRNSEINLIIAKMQSRESRTLKGISILGLLFLPATLVAVSI